VPTTVSWYFKPLGVVVGLVNFSSFVAAVDGLAAAVEGLAVWAGTGVRTIVGVVLSSSLPHATPKATDESMAPARANRATFQFMEVTMGRTISTFTCRGLQA
jgi:hypothetical protein